MSLVDELREAVATDAGDGGNELIESVDFMVEARCPCGSKVTHLMQLTTVADCPRCNRQFAIRSMEYRRKLNNLPEIHFTLGFIEP